MKVRMRVSITGTRDGVEWPAIGGEVDLPDAEGAELCAAGLALPVAQPEKRQTTMAKQAEKRGSRGRSQS